MYINQKSFLNMKQINKLLVILLALVTFSSCETYGDYEIEYTAIYPLCGEWVVNVTGEDGGVLAEGVTCNTYNTTDDATDKMWIKMSVATNDWGVRGKIHCDVTSKSFDGDGIANLLHADDGINSTVTFNISGKVIVDGFELSDPKTNVDKARENIGMVFQHFNLFPHMSVLENIMFAPVEHKLMTREEAQKVGMELLEKVGLADKADANPNSLSGGQKQRVAIARALSMNPDAKIGRASCRERV